MSTYTKMLLMAVIAVCAIGILGAAAAAKEFHSESSSTTLSGNLSSGSAVFTADAGTIECKSATYSGSWSGTTVSSFEIEPSYSECTAFGAISAQVHMNGCKTRSYVVLKDIQCPAGKRVAITTPGCEVTVDTQNGLATVNWTGGGSGILRKLFGHFFLTGLKYEEHNKGFFPTCKNNTVAKTNGTFNADLELRGSSGGKSVGIWVE